MGAAEEGRGGERGLELVEMRLSLSSVLWREVAMARLTGASLHCFRNSTLLNRGSRLAGWRAGRQIR